MTHKPFATRAAALLVALMPFGAWAAGTATLQSGGESNTMAWLDSNTIRFDMPSAEGGYMLSRDGKTYMVNTNASGGMPPVMEIGGMVQGFAETMKDDEDGGASPLAVRIDSVKATGKKQTVAGIQGDVYELTTTDGQGKSKTAEAVLTGDALATEMTAAYFTFSKSMVGAENVDQFMRALPKGKRGLLRMGDDMVVQTISKNGPAASAFEVPAKPTNMADMMKQLMEKAQQAQ